MGTVTMEQLHEDLVGIKKKLEHLTTVVEEDYGLAEDVVIDIEESKARPREKMISHEEMRKEFG